MRCITALRLPSWTPRSCQRWAFPACHAARDSSPHGALTAPICVIWQNAVCWQGRYFLHLVGEESVGPHNLPTAPGSVPGHLDLQWPPPLLWLLLCYCCKTAYCCKAEGRRHQNTFFFFFSAASKLCTEGNGLIWSNMVASIWSYHKAIRTRGQSWAAVGPHAFGSHKEHPKIKGKCP